MLLAVVDLSFFYLLLLTTESALGISSTFTQSLVDSVADFRIPVLLSNTFISLLLLLLFASAIRSVFHFSYRTVEFRFLKAHIDSFCESILQQGLTGSSYRLTQSQGSEWMRAINDVENSTNIAIRGFLNLLYEFCLITGVATVVILRSPPAVLLALIANGLLLVFLMRLFRKRSMQIGQRSATASRRRIAFVNDCLKLAREINLYNLHLNISQKFRRIQKEASTGQQAILVGDLAPILYEFAALLGLTLVVALTAASGASNSRILELLGLLSIATLRLIPSMSRVFAISQHILTIRGSLEKTYHLLKSAKLQGSGSRSTSETSNGSPIPKWNEVSLNDISVQHVDSDAPTFSQLSFVIRRGDWIGIWGESGVGKSTLVDFLSGLLVPQEGHVLIDGKPTSLDSFEWRQTVAIAPQETVLLNQTIAENIHLGAKPDVDSQLFELAVGASGLDRLLFQRGLDLDTVITESGSGFSGGEKQRIGLARAIYRNPQLLLLDEATSALDAESERKILSEIRDFRPYTSVVIVSHRRSTLEVCTKIITVSRSWTGLANS